MSNDEVNHPPHYTKHPSGIECITITQHMNFCRGNAIKYIWRAGQKGDPAIDLRKAIWYLEQEVRRLADAPRIASGGRSPFCHNHTDRTCIESGPRTETMNPTEISKPHEPAQAHVEVIPLSEFETALSNALDPCDSRPVD